MFASMWPHRWFVALLLFHFLFVEILDGANASTRKSIFDLNDELNESADVNASCCIVEYLRTYFDAVQATRKTIYLIANNNSDDINSVQRHFLTELHNTESPWLSVQVFTLAESLDFSQSDSSLVNERRDFLFFYSEIDAERAMDQLIVDSQFDSPHLHVICVKKISDEQISSILTSLTKTRFGRNVNVFVPGDRGKWAWYSVNANNRQCDGSGASVEAEFGWRRNRCVRMDDKRSENGPRVDRQTIQGHKRCPLKVASIHSPPYTYYDEQRSFYKGIDYFMIETVAEKLSLDIVYRFINATEYFDIVNTAEEFNQLNAG